MSGWTRVALGILVASPLVVLLGSFELAREVAFYAVLILAWIYLGTAAITGEWYPGQADDRRRAELRAMREAREKAES